MVIGLATMVVSDAEFPAAVSAYASRLAMGPPIAQALTKRLLVQSFDRPLDVATLSAAIRAIKIPCLTMAS